MFWRFVRVLLTLAAAVLVAGSLAFLYLGWQINHTGARDRAQKADTIVILGARVELDGQPGPDLRVRTQHAVDLFRQGLAPYLVCTGGYHGDRMSAAAVARELAISLGVPPEQALLADGSMTTREDAGSATDLMVTRGWRTAILVSHPLHLERARLLFEGQGIIVYPSPTSTDLQAIPWHTRLWLTTREAVGIVWNGLEDMGVSHEWTNLLSEWVYGVPMTPEVN